MAANALSIGQKIEMTRFYGSGLGQAKEVKTYVSQLLDIKDASRIYIAMPMEGGKMFLLENGDKYNLYFYAQTGLYHCVAQVENRYRSKQIYLAEMVFLSEVEKYQRRQFYRLNCILDMTYRRKDGTDSPQQGVIIDISGGGLRFNSKQPHEPGTELVVEFQLVVGGAVKKYAVSARVISSTYLVNKDKSVYENRMEFTDIAESMREDIVKYIFEEERKRRKRD